MSKLRRLRRKRALQKMANIREMALRRNLSATLGSGNLMKSMTRDHQDVLQNIEFVLVTRHREDSSIDDRIIADALKAAINGDMPENTLTQSVNESLEGMREFRSDVSDEIWRNCLQTVLQSVHRHSSLRSGSTDYLDFVSDYIL